MAETMRAAMVREFGPAEGVQLGVMPRPEPGPGEVLIAIHAAPVNFVDLYVTSGTYQFLPKLPFVPGKGPSGVVAALGAGVTNLAVGDRVLAMAEQGGYAEFVAVKADQCYRLPDGLSFLDAASMSLAYDTAWFALKERGRLREGETLLVLGASGAVGLASVQLGKAWGCRVLAGIARPEMAGLVRAAGADAVIDLSVPDLRDGLRDQVRDATGGAMADVVMDPLGADPFDAALRAMAWCGRLVVVGFAAGRIPSVKANYLLVKNIEVSGLQISDYRKRRPDLASQCFNELFALFAAGKIKPPETMRLPLERAGEGLAAVRDRATAGRRVVLLPVHTA